MSMRGEFMKKKIIVLIMGLLSIPCVVLSENAEGDNNLNGHVYELKSQTNEKSPSGKHIEIIFDPSQEGEELNFKKFKFNLGSNWGVVSNDSSFTVSMVSMKPLKNNGFSIEGLTGQDTDEIRVKIELTDYDSSKAQFTKALVNITGKCSGDYDGELVLSLNNLHMQVIKIR